MAKKSSIDGLTDLQRLVVREKVLHPHATAVEIGRAVGFRKLNVVNAGGASLRVGQILRSPTVKAALKNPPPTVAAPQGQDKPLDPHAIDLTKPGQVREWLLGWYKRIVESKVTPHSERIRALNAISEMTPGARVPVGVNHSGTLTLESLVESMGGRPSSAVSVEDEPAKH